MMRMVRRARANARGAAARSPPISTMSALSMATSVPLPIAMPTSASFRAGESLIPSPIMATPFLPCPEARSLRTLCSNTQPSFSCGSTSAYTMSEGMPAFSAMARAQAALSPVSIYVLSPSRPSARTASRLPAFSVSASPNTASSSPSEARYKTVCPRSERAAKRSSRPPSETPFSAIILSFPRRYCLPSTLPRAPLPMTYSTSRASAPCLQKAAMHCASG